MKEKDPIRGLFQPDPREAFREEPDFPQDEPEPIVLCICCSKEWPKSVAAPWNPSGVAQVAECPACTCWECGNLLKDGHAQGCLAVE